MNALVLIFLVLADAGSGSPQNPQPPGSPEPDRSDPSAAVHGFLNAAHASDYVQAARYLDLEAVPEDRRASEGPRLARRLRFVIDRKLFIDFSTISREPQGDNSHPGHEEIGVIPLERYRQPIRLIRFDQSGKKPIWLFSKETVRSIDRMYELYGPPFAEHLPEILFRHVYFELEPWQWLGLVVCMGFSALVAWVIAYLALALLSRFPKDRQSAWHWWLSAGRGPLGLSILGLSTNAGAERLMLPPGPKGWVDLSCRSLVIASATWFLLRSSAVAAASLQDRAARDAGARSQGLQTQISVLRRVLVFAIYLVGAAVLLMQFEVVRHVGVSLLASAGLAGLVLGLAAQRSISTLLAGIQLSVTQPVRFGDTVLVEGDVGTVEEITLSYVIIRTLDLRHLVVPMTYFLEKPFQNWSRGSPELAAHVTVEASPRIDLSAFRQALMRYLEEQGGDLWDRKIPNVIVHQTGAGPLRLRVLAGAVSPSAGWQLRDRISRWLDGWLKSNP